MNSFDFDISVNKLLILLQDMTDDGVITRRAFCIIKDQLLLQKEKLISMSAIKDIWREFGDVPMNPEIECIENEWRDFPVGTHREEIWHWFEDYFGVSVAEDLMGQGKVKHG